MSMHSGHSRIEFKWISKQNLICIMTQKQNIKNQIDAHSFIQQSDFLKFSFHNQIHTMTRYNAYFLITNE